RAEAARPAGRARRCPRPAHPPERPGAGAARRRPTAADSLLLRNHAIVAVAALSWACGSASPRQKAAVVRAFVTRPPKDTVRFTVGEVAYGVALDSGAVTVTALRPSVMLVVRGAGLAVSAAGRVTAEVAFDAVPVGADTVSCRSRS